MGDKISKFLKKLPQDQKIKTEKIINNIRQGNLAFLDVKKLRGTNNLYRARVGFIRIVFIKGDKNQVIFIGKRNDRTYKDF